MGQEIVQNVSLPPSPIKKRKFVIDSVERREKSVAEPVFATFTNGRPTKDGNLQGNLHQNNTENVRQHKQRHFTVKTPWLSYVGKNYGESSASNRESIFLGILDKNTGKMRLVETSSYTMQPKVAYLEKDQPDSVHEKTYREKQERIVSQFGSKKAKQVMKQRQIYEVSSEGMSGAIHHALEDVEVKEEDMKVQGGTADSDYLDLLPEFDGDAKTPEEVYRLEWIAPDCFLVSFESTAKSYLADEIKFEETYSNLMRVIVSIAKFESQEESKVRLISLALYVEYLIRFSKLKSSQMQRRETMLEGCPTLVKNHIVKEYTNGRERLFSAVDKDRVLCLILVLALVGCKYEVFTNTLIESLQIDLKKLHLLMKAIGATYIKENFSFQLKFPLTRIAKSFKRMAKSLK